MFIAYIEGMGCAHCVTRVKNALEEMGADIIEVKKGSARFNYSGNSEDITPAIEALGFTVTNIETA